MKYVNIKKLLAVVAITAFTIVACKKVEVPTPLGDAGTTLVKILGGGTPAAVTKFAIDFVPTPTVLLVASIRRDIPNETELAKTMVVTIKDDTTAVRAANASYIQLPTSWYTVAVAGGVKSGGQGGTFTLTFAPGEYAKEIYVTIPDATLMNPSALYGLGFTVTTADAGAKLSTEKSVVVQIGAKNIYDGVYRDDFCNYHPSSNPGYTCSTTVIHMVTTGANTCKMFWPLAGAFGIPSVLGGNLAYFGAQEPAYTVNPATGACTVQNVAAGAVTFYTMSAGFNSRYEAGPKVFYVKYGYNNPGGVFDPAATREWTQTLTYTGPR